MSKPDLEEIVLLGIETGLLQLHHRSSTLSSLVDTPELSFDNVAAASRELIVDVGEISRHNMMLVEEMVADIRTLQQAHQLRVKLLELPPRRLVSRPQYFVLAMAVVVGLAFTAYLIGYVQGFPEGCARGIREAIANRAP